MPSVTVHLRLAQRVLDHWSASPGHAPFPADDPATRNAFRAGAIGPDLGYFPGGHRPLSDLAHTFRSGDLCRALLDLANSPHERAFAWGWVTHVLADTLIHPLVGCGVGELHYGSPRYFVDGDSDQVAHVRVEAGIDALYADRYPELRRGRIDPVFDEDSITYLIDAYHRTYGATPAAPHFLASHRLAGRRAMQGAALAAMASLAMPSDPAQDQDEPGPVRAARSFVGRQSVALACLLPAPPSLWLINAVRDVEETFVDLFIEEYEAGGSLLQNVNLDTGRPDLSERWHGGLLRSLTLLDRLGAPVGMRALDTA
ncbi:MAG TPA: zinc dependent phospholipase C family protein [Longimicrobiales bacterium]|nr:zinc dependent phospholipase C family protein [Longimicrobiales bacterium]